MAEAAFKEGLEDVVAGESSICYIDGNKGVLSYRGYNIHTLAAHASFEETAYLLWYGSLPNRGQLLDLRARLSEERHLPDAVVGFLDSLPNAAPMDVLRTAVSMLSHYDPDAQDMSDAANQRKAIRLTSQIAMLVAYFHRLRNGRRPVEADPEASHAAAFLEMLNGQAPGPNAERAMDVALVLHADHELNASTFAARVAAATLTDIHSAIVSAIGTLKGPLHGGANAEVMKMLLEIGDTAGLDRAEAVIRAKLARKEKVAGFGHRVYRTEDPRAMHLRRLSKALGEKAGQPQWYAMTERIEQVVKAEKGLYANVDLYSASMFYALGLPVDLYTPIFAVSRVSGWTAHVLEQYANNRLIRPRADYIGPAYPQTFLPLDQR
jgi:citrate synthase